MFDVTNLDSGMQMFCSLQWGDYDRSLLREDSRLSILVLNQSVFMSYFWQNYFLLIVRLFQ